MPSPPRDGGHPPKASKPAPVASRSVSVPQPFAWRRGQPGWPRVPGTALPRGSSPRPRSCPGRARRRRSSRPRRSRRCLPRTCGPSLAPRTPSSANLEDPFLPESCTTQGLGVSPKRMISGPGSRRRRPEPRGEDPAPRWRPPSPCAGGACRGVVATGFVSVDAGCDNGATLRGTPVP
jgi:hypothetical protein